MRNSSSERQLLRYGSGGKQRECWARFSPLRASLSQLHSPPTDHMCCQGFPIVLGRRNRQPHTVGLLPLILRWRLPFFVPVSRFGARWLAFRDTTLCQPMRDSSRPPPPLGRLFTLQEAIGAVASRLLAFSPLANAGGYRPFIQFFSIGHTEIVRVIMPPLHSAVPSPHVDRIGSLASSAFSPLASGGGYRPFNQCGAASSTPASVD